MAYSAFNRRFQYCGDMSPVLCVSLHRQVMMAQTHVLLLLLTAAGAEGPKGDAGATGPQGPKGKLKLC
jgi:hypothetical protein